MNNSDNILNELREISPLLAGMEKINVYTVPNGYFEGMAQQLQQLVKEEESSLSLVHKKQPLMDVPAGYFDSLADTILNKIKAEDNSGEYPVLSRISRENVYSAPQGYFETLSTEIIHKVNRPQAKLVGMKRNTGWFKYAAAAVFAGMVTIGVFKFIPTKGVSEDPAVAEGRKIAKENKFDEELAKVTDEDIVKYLQANGTDVDAAMVASTVDENELPSKEDYLTDDKALDKYLDNIDLTDLKN